jgi:hypothetical protein
MRDAKAERARRKFLRIFPGGFHDDDYVALERDYKWVAHEAWAQALRRDRFRTLLGRRAYDQIATHAVRVESRTNLLFSFEKMALRDALKPAAGARAFAEGLYAFLYARGTDEHRFAAWVEAVASLPRRQTRVLTWPVVTVFGFIAEPHQHIFLKPNVTRVAARKYGCDFVYRSSPNWETYASYRDFAERVRADNADLRPRDMIDLQSFIWVQGSDEY